MNRRRLIQLAAAAAAAAPSLTKAIAAVQDRSAAEVAADEDFWSAVRNEFTIDRMVVNLNNGHVSPAPRTVQEAMRRYLDYSNMGPYHTMIRQLEPKIEMSRKMIAETAGCDAEEIAITRNSSESLEIAQFGVKLSAGDEVVTTNQDYPRMLTTFATRAKRDGIKVKEISFPVPVASMDDLYQRFEQAVTPATKLILVCHITNRTGQIFPVRRISDMAHARGIKVICDGAHAFNHFPFRIPDLGCDYYGVSLHKWTFAPVGTGFLYVRKALIPETEALMASRENQIDNIRKFEEIGTHPSANYAAICEAIAFNQNIGIERKAARLRYLKDRWTNALAGNPKIKILHNPDPTMSCGIGMLTLKDGDLRALGRALEANHAIFTAISPHAEYIGMRVTPSVYTSVRDIDYFVKAVETELKKV